MFLETSQDLQELQTNKNERSKKFGIFWISWFFRISGNLKEIKRLINNQKYIL